VQKIKKLKILSQPNDLTCGPTCLHAIYHFYQDKIDLESVIQEVEYLNTGGTLAVLLGIHALKRGYQVTINVLDLQIFDPTWFFNTPENKNNFLIKKLEAQILCKEKLKIKQASEAYIQFLKLGGEIISEDLSSRFLKTALEDYGPILTGLSATYLYRSAREIPGNCEESCYDDIRGEPMGHFVVISGYQPNSKTVLLADPYSKNPKAQHYYQVKIARLINAILIGELTYDANLLFIRPKD